MRRVPHKASHVSVSHATQSLQCGTSVNDNVLGKGLCLRERMACLDSKSQLPFRSGDFFTLARRAATHSCPLMVAASEVQRSPGHPGSSSARPVKDPPGPFRRWIHFHTPWPDLHKPPYRLDPVPGWREPPVPPPLSAAISKPSMLGLAEPVLTFMA